MTTAWFHCFAGTAGDMTMGALVHAGADQTRVMEVLAALDLDGYALTFEPVLRCGIAATHAVVVTDAFGHEVPPDMRGHHHDADDHDHGHDRLKDSPTPGVADPSNGHESGHGGHGHRAYREIRELLDRAPLPERVRDRAQRTFRLLAEVEAQMHRTSPDEVEFHEVGALDAIVDVVGACAALEALDVDRIVCSPISVGQGQVHAAHGDLPNPAPAVTELLARRHVPTRGIADHRELATPTGVALMVALADEFGPLPAMEVSAVGYGAGSREIPGRPNVVQVVVGEATSTSAGTAPGDGQPAQLLECNVDDVTGEVLAHTIAALLAAGAHDAWATPIVMKKGRPAHTVHALCPLEAAERVRTVLLAETGSLGVRGSVVHRWPQARTTGVVHVEGHPIGVKVSEVAGVRRVKVEHDDAAVAAAALGLPLRAVLDRAQASAAATLA